MSDQPALFDLSPRCTCSETCKTCGAQRPDDFTRYLFLEPVSGECPDCNHKTVMGILDAHRRRDKAALSELWLRHYPPKKRNRRR